MSMVVEGHNKLFVLLFVHMLQFDVLKRVVFIRNEFLLRKGAWQVDSIL